ncbi:MAG: hypothetical protein COA78_20245 [Blastopirellula sp.]|nr:MAG: hypothetical protein COA78_20245 [Blastopirellula sp.]
MAGKNINDTTVYPNTTPDLADHVIGTDVSDTGNSSLGETVTFLWSAVLSMFNSTTATLTNKTISTASNNITVVEADISDLGTYSTATGVENNSDVTDATNVAAALTLTGDVTTSASFATTIAAKAVDVAMLADGIDGELVTWGATGVAETVAVGTANQVLTSNGIGVAPTFQTLAGGGDALVANPLSQFAATTSLQLKGVISDETGSGALAFATSPTLVTPVLGTPASGVMTNVTGTASGLTAGNVTTNANLTGHITSIGNAAILGSFTVAQLNTALSDGIALNNIVDDTTPQLGGNLDPNSNQVSGDWLPVTDSLYDIGSATFAWAEGHFDTLYQGGNQVTALADPGADRGYFWDASASTMAFHTVEGNISYTGTALRHTEVWGSAASDETTALTTGTGKVTFRIPYAFTVTGVYANVVTAPTGAALVVDINEAGTTILSTKITIDVSEFSGGSTGYQGTAATAAVISDAAIAANAAISVDVDTIGSTVAGAGLKVYLVGYRT